jgi:COMPASS component SWD2
VTGLSLSPQDDTFLSCSLDNTVRLWDLKQDKAAGSLNLKTPYFASFDPSATVIAIASPATSNVLLYDKRNYDKPPFATYDTRDYETSFHPRQVGRTWTGLEFSNDGKHVLVTTSAYGHFLLNAFDGNLEAFLARKTRSGRLAPGQEAPPGATASAHALGQGDACFTPDGRYVLSGGANEGVMVFDTQQQPDHEKRISPMTELPFKGKASTIAFNHQYHMFASADKELVMWLPDKSLMQQQLEDAR